MKRITGRHAGYDANGNQLSDWDVLDAREIAADHGWISPLQEPVEIDPGLVERLVALQRRAA